MHRAGVDGAGPTGRNLIEISFASVGSMMRWVSMFMVGTDLAFRDEVHAAFRAISWGGLPHFWMHWANVDRLFCAGGWAFGWVSIIHRRFTPELFTETELLAPSSQLQWHQCLSSMCAIDEMAVGFQAFIPCVTPIAIKCDHGGNDNGGADNRDQPVDAQESVPSSVRPIHIV